MLRPHYLGRLSWARRLGSKNRTRLRYEDVDAGPVFHDGSIFAGSVSGGLYRLDARQPVKSFGRSIYRTFIAAWEANRFGLVALTMDGFAYGISESGQKRFVTKLPSNRLEGLLVGKSLALISAGETGLVLLETERGKPIHKPEPWAVRHLAYLAPQGGILSFRTLGLPLPL